MENLFIECAVRAALSSRDFCEIGSSAAVIDPGPLSLELVTRGLKYSGRATASRARLSGFSFAFNH